MGNIFGKCIFAKKSVIETKKNRVEAWSEQVRDRVARDGIVKVVKDEIDELVEVGSADPSFLISKIESWLSADREYCHLCTDKNKASLLSRPHKRSPKPGPSVPGVIEGDGRPVKVYHGDEFTNWGDTVNNFPSYTFVPKTKAGVQNIVLFAKKNALRVRVSGSRHSWSDVFGRNGDVMISMMEIDAAVPDNDWAKNPLKTTEENPYDKKNELQRIEFLGPTDDGKHALIRLGGATTSEHFRQWALSEQAFEGSGGNWEWMLQALPILVSITSSGWTQVICHGAGIDHQSVSDLCQEIEFVNFNGELQKISDRNQLKAASGAFGLLGVITSHVFRLDPLKIADMAPLKVPAPLGVPPLTYDGIPKNADFSTKDYSRQEWEDATTRFYADCTKFYAEWFWFPFHEKAWINCWDTEEKGPNPQPQYPTPKDVKFENEQSRLFWIFQNTLLKFLPPIAQSELTSFAAMKFLPPHLFKSTKTTVPDALHFRRGIHRMPVRDCEFSMEIPEGPSGPDFRICQKAWWAVIEEVYKDKAKGKAPMRTTLEMRIVGGSDTIMSTQNGNRATCAIEVLTSTLTDEEEWNEFIIRIANRWAEIADTLQFKPHFAKEWPKKIGNDKTDVYMKKAYADKIPEFVKQLSATCNAGGYSFDDALGLFGNDTIMDLIGKSTA